MLLASARERWPFFMLSDSVSRSCSRSARLSKPSLERRTGGSQRHPVPAILVTDKVLRHKFGQVDRRVAQCSTPSANMGRSRRSVSKCCCVGRSVEFHTVCNCRVMQHSLITPHPLISTVNLTASEIVRTTVTLTAGAFWEKLREGRFCCARRHRAQPPTEPRRHVRAAHAAAQCGTSVPYDSAPRRIFETAPRLQSILKMFRVTPREVSLRLQRLCRGVDIALTDSISSIVVAHSLGFVALH